MTRRRLPDNAKCIECGDDFRTYGCIRCERCRRGKFGVRANGRMGWHYCPVCKRRKSYKAKVCRACWLQGIREVP